MLAVLHNYDHEWHTKSAPEVRFDHKPKPGRRLKWLIGKWLQQLLTILSNGLGCVVEGSAVFVINVDLLRVVITRLELGHILHAVNKMSRPLGDASNTCSKQLFGSTFLDERVAAANWTRHWRRRVHCMHNRHVSNSEFVHWHWSDSKCRISSQTVVPVHMLAAFPAAMPAQ